MLNILKTTNNNIKCRLQKEEEYWGSLDPGRHSTRLSLYLLASISLYCGLGFMAIKSKLIYDSHLKFAFKNRNLQKTLIWPTLIAINKWCWSRSTSKSEVSDFDLIAIKNGVDRDLMHFSNFLTSAWSRSVKSCSRSTSTFSPNSWFLHLFSPFSLKSPIMNKTCKTKKYKHNTAQKKQ